MLLYIVNLLVCQGFFIFPYFLFIFIGYPQLPDLQFDPNFASVTILNWTTGEGTAKYWITKLLIETAQIDQDQTVITQTADVTETNIFSQAFIRKNGQKWVLIVNKRYADINVILPESTGGLMRVINEESTFGPAINITLTSNEIKLTPFGVAIIHMP